jgi:hypothetical protein
MEQKAVAQNMFISEADSKSLAVYFYNEPV